MGKLDIADIRKFENMQSFGADRREVCIQQRRGTAPHPDDREPGPRVLTFVRR